MISTPAFTQQDYGQWIQCLESLDEARSHLERWLETRLKKFFPFEKLLLAIGSSVAGEIRVESLITVGHTEAYLEQLDRSFDVTMRGSFQAWISQREPFVIIPEHSPGYASNFELQEIERFHFRNVAAHGVLNASSNSGTYCSFSGIGDRPEPWVLHALRLIAPVLNDLILTHAANAFHQADRDRIDSLSISQKRLLRLVTGGQPNKQIAHELGISEKTVRNRLTALYAHFEVSNRTQLSTHLRSH
jgi:DNA-binding CsgD family transcriptional regulator